MIVELKMSNDIWSEDKHGKEKLIKKGVVTSCEIDTDLITFCCEVLNGKGNVIKNRCKIIMRGSDQPLVVNHSYRYISDLRKVKPIKGFRK